jgi:apolipoprotein N-acyltransferase
LGALTATVVSGLLYGLLFPPVGGVALSWVALVPLVLALRSRSFPAAAGLAALFAWLGTASVIPWLASTLHDHFDRSWPFGIAFWLLFSAGALAPYYAPLLAAQAWAARRLPRAWAPFLFAAAWVGAEWCRAQLGFRSPWTRLGDAHAHSVHLRQVADLVGVYGVSFIVAFWNALLADAVLMLHRRLRGGDVAWRPLLVVGACGTLMLGLAMLYGGLRLRELPSVRPGFEVAVVQGNLAPELRWKQARAGQVLRRYGGLTRDLLVGSQRDRPPDLVVWPENAIQTSVTHPVYGPPLLGLASKAPILLGAPRSEREGGARHAFNSAFLLAADGVRDHYDKRRLLPFSETHPLGGLGSFGSRGDLDASEYTAGTRGALFDVGAQRLAPLICMEALYPALAREAARDGATMLVNLSNDGWFAGRGGAQQHLEMVIFRAVEVRRPVVRATTTGISAVIGPDGALRARLPQGEKGVLRVEVPAAPDELTLYTRTGDAFAVGCTLATLGAALVGVRRGPHAPWGAEPSNPPRNSA